MTEARHDASVVIADDHAATRNFLTILLEENGLRVVGQAANGDEAVRLCERLRPNLVVLDISMPVLDGLESARRIAKLCPASKIIFLTGHTGQELAQEALRAGGVGFVTKDNAAHDLLEAIDTVLKGKTYISGETAA